MKLNKKDCMVPLPIKRKNRNRSRRPFSSSRLLESNGPDIKIKGSALQIVDKYMALSREYQTSGDPITAESYLQYAEHYQRIVDANELKIQQNQVIEKEKNQTNTIVSEERSVDETLVRESKVDDEPKPSEINQPLLEENIIGK
jgi:hypothetical protein